MRLPGAVVNRETKVEGYIRKGVPLIFLLNQPMTQQQMFSIQFMTTSSGATPEEAFKKIVDEATDYYESLGMGKFSGSVAEKSDFTLLSLPKDGSSWTYAKGLLDEDAPVIADPYGPAGCVPIGLNKWLFFGWAPA